MKYLCLTITLIVESMTIIQAQPADDRETDAAIFSRFLTLAQNSPTDSLMTIAAKFFLETPYVAGTLDRQTDEQLTVNLREMDCTTFVETCLALARSLLHNVPDMQTFEQELRKIRYRNGVQGDYISRLHYASDWIFDNIRKGTVEDKTPALGGKKLQLKTGFMSNNANKYPQLAKNDTLITEIRRIENEINSRTNCFYIPKNDIPAVQSLIRDGDIIFFTTSIDGLDISHLGIALYVHGYLRFVHASQTAGKVIINPESLSDYCTKIRTNTGIMVIHPLLGQREAREHKNPSL
jgi:cell wall-associated NlpC family hydrolase